MSGFFYEPPEPPEPPHVGPAVENYPAIGKKLKQLEADRTRRVQAQPLPEPGPVPDRKPWWNA